jgi:hypothetical protein
LQGAYLPAETLIVAWINAQGWLVGAGNPLPLGAIRANRRRRSPGQGAYAAISLIASSRDPSEAPIHAEAAAVAYANLLDQTDGQPVNLGTATLLIADSITGPLYSPDGDEHRYLVDATCHLTPI